MSEMLVLTTTKIKCCASCAHSKNWRNQKGHCRHSTILEIQKALFPNIHQPQRMLTFSWRFKRYMDDVCRDCYELASREQMQERLNDERERLRKGVQGPHGMSGTEYRFLMQLIHTWKFLLDAQGVAI